MKITYYLDIFSSWCHWAEPAWDGLKTRYAGQVDFHWKIAAMNPADFPASVAQNEWFYQRSGTVMRSPVKLDPRWVEPARQGVYPAPNHVAEAARDFLADPEDDRVRLALSRAAMLKGQKIGDPALAVSIAAKAARLDPKKLRKASESAAVKARVAASTAEFFSHGINQRPAFILESAIGDKAVFSGLARIEPLAAAIDALLADARRYASFAAHFGPPPKA